LSLDLLEPVLQLLEEVKSQTGKPVRIKKVAAECLYGGGEINVERAFGKKLAHLITHIENLQQAQWKISHECLHILRITSVPIEDRLILNDDPETVANGFRILFGMDNPYNRKEVPVSEFNKWNSNRLLILSGLLASGIQDLWVDQEIQRRYSETQICGEMFEAYQVWSETRLRNDLELDTFDKCYEILNAVNWATLNLGRSDYLARKIDALALFDQHPPVISLGDKLIFAVRKRTLDSYKDDMDIIDEWASILGIRSCYFWWNPETKKDVRVRN